MTRMNYNRNQQSNRDIMKWNESLRPARNWGPKPFGSVKRKKKQWHRGCRLATTKQLNYLKSLCKKNDRPPPPEGMSRKAASTMISKLLDIEKRKTIPVSDHDIQPQSFLTTK